MPPTTDPTSLIARHEADMFEYCRRILSEMNTGHRNDIFNRLFLPLCQPLVGAIGCRMAYDAGVKMNVPTELFALYEVGVIKMDSSWYVEHAGLGRQVQHEMEDRAASALLPNLEMWLEKTNGGPYCTAPILSQG
jgi:acyl-CoA oxidase